jgi:NitT/TauT family transport system substrate-binding protein
MTVGSRDISRREAMMLAAGASAGLLMPVAARAATAMRYVTPFNFSLSFSPVLYAVASGLFAKEGLDVEVVNGKGASVALQLVIAGQAQVSRSGGANYMVARVNSGAPLVSIGTIAQVSPFFVVSSPKAKINSPADMKGKTIGVASLGGSMEDTLRLMLSNASVDAASVERVKVADVPASYGLIEAGRIYGFMASISSVIKILAAVPTAHAIPIDDGVPGQIYVATPKTLAENGDHYVKFLRAVHASVNAIVDAKDKRVILDAIGGKFEIPGIKDTPTALEDITRNSQTWVAKGRENILRNIPEHWAAAVDALSAGGILKQKPDAKSLYDNSFLDKALGKS